MAFSIGRIVLTGALAVFAAAAVASGLDRESYRALGVEQSVPRPFRAQADRSAAVIALSRQEAAAALRHATAAVAHDPVDRDSTALLGAAQLLANRSDAAAASFRVAARFGWRNTATQLYWFDAAMTAGDLAVATDRADAVLRVHPAFAQRENLLETIETTPKGRELIATHLRQRPFWLPTFLKWNAAIPAEALNNRVKTVLGLAQGTFRLPCDEVAPFVTTLVDRGHRADAERVWNAHCRENPVQGFVADQQFAWIDDPDRFPFTWQVHRSGDVSVTSERDASGKRTLAVANSATAPREILDQAVALPPGSYRLKVELARSGPAAAGRVLGSIGCGEDAPFPRAGAGDATGEGQLISAGTCDRQQLGIWLAPGQALKIVRIELNKAS